MRALEHSLVFLTFLTGLYAYTWPSNIDYLEGVMYQQAGYRRFGVIDGVTPCSFSSEGEGKQAAAEWVRTAFHDMITHNAADGTGGMDASIMFEMDRPENPGSAFNSTMNFMINFYNIQTSMADLFALAVYAAVRACGGPRLSMRGGRVDATGPGVAGVPEPTDDLETIVAQFATAGFNTTEMIQMVACGHSLGGVHGIDFPDITGDNSSTNFVHFDSTFSSFDSAIVTDYLGGATGNPLVVGPEGSNSDLLVFTADGNATMRSISDALSFSNTCQAILQRMIDVVPSSVTLSAIIDSIPIKPVAIQLTFDSSGTLAFTGEIRVLISDRDDTELTVQLHYADHDGDIPSNNTISTAEIHSTGYGYDAEFKFYAFSAAVPNGISSFNISVAPSSGGEETYDNGGSGYPIQDNIIFLSSHSCLVQETDANGNWNLTAVAAVRNDESLTNPSFDVVVKTPRIGIPVPSLAVESSAMEVWNTDAYKGFTLYTGHFSLPIYSWSTTFDVTVGEYSDSFKFSTALSGTCS
ncbi:heme peroxidase [Guyanagaster necrorhizus]|uniref:Peroxidase n=1 Tax=Guyanagaster necrorhizus TaxID=856835 RepID=A0A9P7W0C5_9AGAR|nr:heme peroxidase [Guyanagaster necrorhizus MCA 3950]KAG7450055.1 heme peroxidase [Guyanagaster necrorhizus MCA 3950]